MDGPRGPAAASSTSTPPPAAPSPPAAPVKGDKPNLKVTMKQPKRAMDVQKGPATSPTPTSPPVTPSAPPAAASPIGKKPDLKMTMKQPKRALGETSQPPTPSAVPPAAPSPSATRPKPPPPAIKNPVEESVTEIPGIVDPSRARDMQGDGNEEKSDLSSDTVVLKVVKEKKKKLAGILSQSQTIRLRLSGGDDKPADALSNENKTPAAPTPLTKGTLKIKSPVAAGGARGAATPAGAARKGQSKSGKALKLKAVSRTQQTDGAAQQPEAAKTAASEARAKQVFQGQSKSQTGTELGIVYVLSSAASLIAVGATTALLMSQYYSLF